MPIWTPTGSEPRNIKALLTTLSASVQSALDTLIKAHGRSEFATTLLRDAYYTSPARGDIATVAGDLQVYDGSIWHTVSGYNEGAQLTRTATTAITSSTSTVAVAFSATVFNRGFTTGTTGITVPYTGTYDYDISVQFLASSVTAVGYRSVRLTVNGANVGRAIGRVNGTPLSGAGTTVASRSGLIPLSAGDVVGMALDQNAGATINYANADLMLMA